MATARAARQPTVDSPENGHRVIEPDGTPVEIARQIVVTYKGQTYSIAQRDEWDIEVIEQIEESNGAKALRLILGDQQYAAFKSRNKAGDVMPMFEAVAKVAGGNS